MAMRSPRQRATEVKSAVRTARQTSAFLVQELKTIDDDMGTFSGYVAVFNNKDGNGDVIERGAFKKTLSEARETKARTHSMFLYPLLWQHKESEPIGGIMDASEDEHGLFIRGQFDLDIEQGRRAYSGVKKGYLRGLSIGYDTIKHMWDQSRTRHLTEIRLWEGSPVTFPANTEAQIVNVKNRPGPADTKAVTGKTSWPLADRDHAWDSGAAHARLLEWAGGKDDFDAEKFASVHFWSPDDRQNTSEYKFPFCDVIGGEVKAVPKGIEACTGAHGVENAKGVDVTGIKSKITTYYGRMAKEFDDTTIAVPWSAKGMNSAAKRDLKQLVGLQALLYCASSLDQVCDGAEGLVETLAAACGMSVEGPDTGEPNPAVAALLGGIDGLDAAIKAVIQAWQDFDEQTDALKAVLGMPDDDMDYGETAVPMYMSRLRSAFELKAGRQLSAANRDRLGVVADGLKGHYDEIKSILRENDKINENDNDVDMDQIIAAGHRPSKGVDRKGQGQKPDNSTTSDQPTEPESASTLQSLEDALAMQRLEFMVNSTR